MTRDFRVLEASLKTLQSYINMSKQGRLEFTMDIPTQLFKIFFDRNPRNNNTTLFERVFKNKNIEFHPLDTSIIAMVMGLSKNIYYARGAGSVYPNPDKIQMELVNLNAPRTMLFEKWKDQILQSIVYLDQSTMKYEKITLDNPTLYQISKIMTKELWKRQGYGDVDVSFPGIEIVEPATEGERTTKQTENIVTLSIKDFIRAIRHKDSAHADPMNNSKWKKEYDQLNATKAISWQIDNHEEEVTNEKFLIDIADYLVWRLNNALLDDTKGDKNLC